jgi:hypothetical protein
LGPALKGDRYTQHLTSFISRLGLVGEISYESLSVKDLRDATVKAYVHHRHDEKKFFDDLKQENLSGWQRIVKLGYIPLWVNNMDTLEWMDKLEEKSNLSLPFGHCVNGCGPAEQYQTVPQDNVVIFECERCFMGPTEWMVAKPESLIRLEKEGYSWNDLHKFSLFYPPRYYRAEDGEWEKIR